MNQSYNNFNQNSAKIYTGSAGGELFISSSSSKQTISASNNRSKYYAELAKKYRDETKVLRDDVKYYAEQNSDVTVEFVNNIKADLLREISLKQNIGDCVLKEDLPTKVSVFENDSQYASINEVNEVVDNVVNSRINVIENDVVQLQTDLSGKMNLDLTNINTTGSSLAAGFAFPSNKYIDLTVGANGARYTAPSNGYVCIVANATAATAFLNLLSTSIPDDYSKPIQISSFRYNAVGQWHGVSIPVRKGQEFTISLDNISIASAIFVYALGSENDAETSLES